MKSVKYIEAVSKLLQEIATAEGATIQKIAGRIKETVDAGALVYVFGSGHSAIFAEEAFHRAGGLIPVYPVLHSFLSPHTTPRISGKLERLEGVAPLLFARTGARKGDLFFIVSNSGTNAAAIEMALACQTAGIETVAVTSLSHSKSVPSRHSSQKKLFELTTHVIDNHCPGGDALVAFGGGVTAGPGSTVANASIWNSLVTEACALWEAEGKTLPIYRSANVPGGDAHNEQLERNYISRIPLL